MRVLLNIDLGEHPDEPDEFFRLANVVNIACGGHAGDDVSMLRALYLAHTNGAFVAAHPSFPDKAGFGRKNMPLSWDVLRERIADQCASLLHVSRGLHTGWRGAEAALRGSEPHIVKLHGALYHAAARDSEAARAVVEGAMRGLANGDLVWIGPPHGALKEIAAQCKHTYLREGFADRGLLADGTLIPRGEAGALITDPARAVSQAIFLAESGDVDTLCVHSDTPNALDIARAVRRALEQKGYLAQSIADISKPQIT
ncbi:MAG: LamB/YcsF family protein [Polyangiaceae bacterium]|nr:LamB/YcsF family protein [Polyangiaceae bacterium]